jgi:hypothetical protein
LKVCTPPPVKKLAGAGGVAPLEGRLQHRRQAAVLGGGEVFHRPQAQPVAGVGLDGAQLGGRLAGVFFVQLGDDLEVGGEHPQLGGGAELELAAFVDVEGLVAGVGLHPHAVAAGVLSTRLKL